MAPLRGLEHALGPQAWPCQRQETAGSELPMRMDKLTSVFQAALSDAQSLAVGRDNQFIEPAHVLVAMLDAQSGSVRPLLLKAGADAARLRTLLGEALE